jgi:hypothetical protein
MKNLYRHPVITSLVITPIFLAVAAVAGGIGHGCYISGNCCLSIRGYCGRDSRPFFNASLPMILIAMIQFPLYGILVGHAQRTSQDRNLIVGLYVLHAVAALISLVDGNFLDAVLTVPLPFLLTIIQYYLIGFIVDRLLTPEK